MELIREYDFAGQHYGLVLMDDGSKVEIQDNDPLTRAQIMLDVGTFNPPLTSEEIIKRLVLTDFSDDELATEVENRGLAQSDDGSGDVHTGIISLICVTIKNAYQYIKGKLGG